MLTTGLSSINGWNSKIQLQRNLSWMWYIPGSKYETSPLCQNYSWEGKPIRGDSIIKMGLLLERLCC